MKQRGAGPNAVELFLELDIRERQSDAIGVRILPALAYHFAGSIESNYDIAALDEVPGIPSSPTTRIQNARPSRDMFAKTFIEVRQIQEGSLVGVGVGI